MASGVTNKVPPRSVINALVKLMAVAVLVVNHMPECCVTQAHMFNLPNLDAQIERFGNKLRHQQRLRAALDLAAHRRYGGVRGGGRFARMATDDNGADFLRGMSMIYPRQAPQLQPDQKEPDNNNNHLQMPDPDQSLLRPMDSRIKTLDGDGNENTFLQPRMGIPGLSGKDENAQNKALGAGETEGGQQSEDQQEQGGAKQDRIQERNSYMGMMAPNFPEAQAGPLHEHGRPSVLDYVKASMLANQGAQAAAGPPNSLQTLMRPGPQLAQPGQQFRLFGPPPSMQQAMPVPVPQMHPQGLEMAMRQQQLQNAIQNIAQQQAAMALQQQGLPQPQPQPQHMFHHPNPLQSQHKPSLLQNFIKSLIEKSPVSAGAKGSVISNNQQPRPTGPQIPYGLGSNPEGDTHSGPSRPGFLKSGLGMNNEESSAQQQGPVFNKQGHTGQEEENNSGSVENNNENRMGSSKEENRPSTYPSPFSQPDEDTEPQERKEKNRYFSGGRPAQRPLHSSSHDFDPAGRPPSDGSSEYRKFGSNQKIASMDIDEDVEDQKFRDFPEPPRTCRPGSVTSEWGCGADQATASSSLDEEDDGTVMGSHKKQWRSKLKLMRDEEWERGAEQSSVIKGTGFGFKDSVDIRNKGKMGRLYAPFKFNHPPVIPEEEELSTKEWIQLLEREERVKNEPAINAVRLKSTQLKD